MLLRAGISRDARTKVDRTPLHVAAQEGHVSIVDLLVRNGADIEAKDMVGAFTLCHQSQTHGTLLCLIERVFSNISDHTIPIEGMFLYLIGIKTMAMKPTLLVCIS